MKAYVPYELINKCRAMKSKCSIGCYRYTHCVYVCVYSMSVSVSVLRKWARVRHTAYYFTHSRTQISTSRCLVQHHCHFLMQMHTKRLNRTRFTWNTTFSNELDGWHNISGIAWKNTSRIIDLDCGFLISTFDWMDFII